MPIVGGRIIRVEAKKKEDNNFEGFEVNAAIESATADKTVLKIKYTYRTEYKPNVAEITVEGELFFEDEEKKVKQYADEFKKAKDEKRVPKLPQEVADDIYSGMNYAGQTVGTLGAFAISVTAPLLNTRVGLAAKTQAQQGSAPAPKAQAG